MGNGGNRERTGAQSASTHGDESSPWVLRVLVNR
jgi:hypothetical protein